MRHIDIKQKLRELDVTLEAISLGDFDLLGEITAKKARSPADPNYDRFGCFFRANYERGVLLYHLIRSSNAHDALEIGFGRGYSALCIAKAFHDMGVDGKITSIDPLPCGQSAEEWQTYKEKFFNIFPWARRYIDVRIGLSNDVIPSLNGSWDLIYIDGDHSYEGTKNDWLLIKDRWRKFVLFDDYHMATKHDPGIQCERAIAEIDDASKELIITDRRMFVDDRGLHDDQIDYGQVLLTRK